VPGAVTVVRVITNGKQNVPEQFTSSTLDLNKTHHAQKVLIKLSTFPDDGSDWV